MIFKVKFKVTQMDSSRIYDWNVVVLIMKHTGSLAVIELLLPGMTYFGHEKKSAIGWLPKQIPIFLNCKKIKKIIKRKKKKKKKK